MALATESAASPMQVALVLVLDRTVDLTDLRRGMAERVTAVPQLRQRLQRAPLGCGRPVWIDDVDFAVDNHVLRRSCLDIDDEAALLEVASAVVRVPLPRARPLWSITVVDDPRRERCALVIVVHHVVTDGAGGLAALARLIDGAPTGPRSPFPMRPPTVWALFVDAWLSRLNTLGAVPARLRLIRTAFAELTRGRVGRPSRCSLNQSTGPDRRLALARADLAAVTERAHERGGTVNDILLAAVVGALADVVRQRGEPATTFVISESVSGRGDAEQSTLGNQVGVRLIPVTSVGDSDRRLTEIIAVTRDRRQTNGSGASAVLLAPGFRLLAALGLLNGLIDHQRLVTTFVTNLHGPEWPISLFGAGVLAVVPVTRLTGNVTVSFAALSYAGTLVVTVISDSNTCPDLAYLTAALQDQLDELSAPGRDDVSSDAAPVGGRRPTEAE